MDENRRNFVRGADAVLAIPATGRKTADRETAAVRNPSARGSSVTSHRGMARGLTLLTMRRNGDYRLGVKTDKGVLDVPEASRLLRMHAAATMDDLLQREDGPSLNALVAAVLGSNSVQKAFVKEESFSDWMRWIAKGKRRRTSSRKATAERVLL
jgi:hypothetical protein